MSDHVLRNSGANLRYMRRFWKAIGGTVQDKRATGEEVYRHPRASRPITVNKRRKSAPRELTSVARRLAVTHFSQDTGRV